jgi:hypothetical protein
MTHRQVQSDHRVISSHPHGTFRADLDVTSYVDRLGGGAGQTFGARSRSGSAYEHNTTSVDSRPYEYEKPMLFGRNHLADTSTCTDLVITPEVIWDVNGYYRALGIPFPHRPVTRRTLGAAHRAAGGLDDRWKTYCLNQLLDAAVRQVYDWMPLGEPYMDSYWDEWLHKQAKIELGRRIAAGEIEAEDAEDGGADRVLEEWGIEMAEKPDPQAASTPSPPRPPTTVDLTWSYYLWRCSYSGTSSILDRLDAWRSLLVEAFRDLGLRLKFRVGFLGKEPHPWMRIEWDGHLVFFLNKEQVPTTEYAAQAARLTRQELGIHTDNVMALEGSPHGAA